MRLTLRRVADDAQLAVEADRSVVPVGELARIVSRFSASECDSLQDGPAAVRMVRGAATVTSGLVQASASAQGLQLTARWPLHREKHRLPRVIGGSRS